MTVKPKVYYETETNTVHCEAANGNDYALCGVALDQDQTTTRETFGDKINCNECLSIIRFCRSLSTRALSAAHGSKP